MKSFKISEIINYSLALYHCITAVLRIHVTLVRKSNFACCAWEGCPESWDTWENQILRKFVAR